jgi:ATP-binding cassette subfamily B multidrug efflux pump
MIGGIYYINGRGNIGIDTIVEFVIYINMLTFPVSAIGWTASMIQRASASQKRLNEFLRHQPLIQQPLEAKRCCMGRSLAEPGQFYLFPYRHHAIRDFSLSVKAGERIAIVGRTGSGKTTLAQLLLRMFDADSGSILMDGT